MREKNTLKSSLQINLSHKYSLVDSEPSGTTSWPSGHLGQLEHPGNVQGSTNTSGMTFWHAGTLLAWMTCWHSRQTHGTGKPMMTHHSLILGRLCWPTQMMWSVYRMVEDGVYGDDPDDISELDQAVNQSILRKPAQPHKPKIKP